jgi:DNA-binding beta-propeller fold protein YncE
MFARLATLAAVFVGLGITVLTRPGLTILPSGWHLSPPDGPLAIVGTMPQGIALSPDGMTLAVVESGVNPAALRLLDAKTLRTRSTIPLKGAFGKPIWLNQKTVLVAGANSDALLLVDASNAAVESVAMPKGAWPAAVARGSNVVATANDGDGTISIFAIKDGTLALVTSLHVGEHPADVAISPDGQAAFVSVRGANAVVAVGVSQRRIVRRITVGRHPSALEISADGTKLFVAESDDDAVAIIDTRAGRRLGDVPVGLNSGRVHGYGANPNALLIRKNEVFVSLGGENAVAMIRNRHVIEYIPAGWYPTGLADAQDGTLYVSDGKGEGAPSNPAFRPEERDSPGYVGAITVGSIRAIPSRTYTSDRSTVDVALADAAPQWTPAPPGATIIHAHGPISHVIYVIKENRSYDQILGDLTEANGDPSLAAFGHAITPNQHAIAQRFGVFDNAYADAQVSPDGHNWTDAATANDYVERFWPPDYGRRRELYDFQSGTSPDVPHAGYIWDAAKRAGTSYRDYGEEDVRFGNTSTITTFSGLQNHYDPRFVGWNLRYSDQDRFSEWKREFDMFVARHNLPQLEIVYFPNDHTAGTQRGMPTPQAYIATNDWVVGQLVEAISHSRYWKSTAVFILEDDAQNGPDHVSDQRSTFYVASAYARGGIDHSHYSTVSVLHTIELMLGLPALSVKDATASPMYRAFVTAPINAGPFNSVKPSVNLDAINSQTAYGSAKSSRLDFSRPDAVDPRVLNDILIHSVHRQ